jgi:hypothetical protein
MEEGTPKKQCVGGRKDVEFYSSMAAVEKETEKLGQRQKKSWTHQNSHMAEF